MITTIIFDIGMVLVDFCWEKYLNSFGFSDEINKEVADAMFLSSAWNDFDKGEFTDEEMLERFINNNPKCENEIRKVFEHVGGTVMPYDYSIPLIKELKEKGFHIYVLSNFPKKTFEQCRECMKFLDLVDGGVISYQVKQIKPDKEIYETLIKKYNINPKNAVFFDDSLKNIEAARKIGFHGIHFTNLKKAREELEFLVNL